MTYSIRFKLFAVFVLLLIVFQLIFLVTNSYFLDDIFVWGNKRIMIKLYEDYKSNISKGYEEEALIHELNNDFDGNIAIIDFNMSTITSTYTRFSRARLVRIIPTIRQIMQDNNNLSKQGTYFFISPQNNSRLKTIVLIGKLDENKLFIIEKPFGIVYSSSRIAESFIIISGIGTLIIGSIVVFFLSGRLAKPIISINKAATEIANLNFLEKVNITTKDEIGELGKSMNLISDKLSQTLSELTEANEKLKEDIEKERSLEKMRRRFVSSVSHELKTPISLIQGYADGLKFNIAKKPEDMRYYCDVIIDEAAKMSCLVRDLLDLSAYESGTFTISKTDFDIAELVRNITDKHKKELSEEEITLVIKAPDKCIVNADRLRIEQIVTNFMSNAKRYVKEKGEIKISLIDQSYSVHMAVYNSGSHIDASEMDNIWTSFYKIDMNNSHKGEGTGLGLAIVKAIMELHNGRYGALNIEDGIAFWVELPKSITNPSH